MMRHVVTFAIAMVVGQVGSDAVRAECVVLPASAQIVAERIYRSTHVFLGTVVEIQDDRSTFTYRARFSIERIYKGDIAGQPWLNVYRVSQLTCSWWTAKVGDRDIFFVTKGTRDDRERLMVGRESKLNGNEHMVREALKLLKSKPNLRR